jgi:hypothetical protein
MAHPLLSPFASQPPRLRDTRHVLLPFLLAACSTTPSTRDVRVTIVDEVGDPLPGAVFYAEAYDESGAFAFLTARAGEAGVLPDQAREPLKIAWRPDARLALAAFHPGYRPVVLRDPSRRIQSDGALITLTRGGPEPLVVRLSFPFEEQPDLAERLGAPEYGELRAAFRRAYAALRTDAGGTPPKALERKTSTLDAIERRNPLQALDEAAEDEESGSPQPPSENHQE